MQIGLWDLFLLNLLFIGVHDQQVHVQCPAMTKLALSEYRKKTQTCSEPTERFNNVCWPWGDYLPKSYKCVKAINVSMGWPESQACCKHLNMTLFKIGTKEMNDELYDYLKMKNRLKSFWVGLHFSPSQNKWVWNNETSTPTYTNWLQPAPTSLQSQQQKLATSFRANESNSYWQKDLRTDQIEFLCEKIFPFDPLAQAPVMVVQYHRAPSTVFLGYMVRIWCSTLEGRVTWTEKTLGQAIQKNGLQRRRISDPNPCTFNSSLIQYLRITNDTRNTQIQCCSQPFFSGIKTCNATQPLSVIKAPSHPQAPTLDTVHYDVHPHYLTGGRRLELRCSGSLGQQRGQLVWQLAWINSTALWSVDDDLTRLTMRSPAVGVPGVSLGPAKRHPSNSSIESRLSVLVSSTLNNSLLACLAVSKYAQNSTDTVNGSKALRSETQIYFSVLFFPKKPHLTSEVFSKSDATHHRGHCHAMCKAYVGTRGVMTWVLYHPKRIFLWTVDLDGGRHFSKFTQLHIYDLTVIIDYNDTLKGPVLTSMLDFDLKRVANGSYLICYSYNATGIPDFTYNDPLRVAHRIDIIDRPFLPVLLLEEFLLFIAIVWLVTCAFLFFAGRRSQESDIGEVASNDTPEDDVSAVKWKIREPSVGSRTASIFSFRNVLRYFRRTSSQASSVGSKADDRSLHSRRRIKFSSVHS
ncbi:hypothetical protein RRG08_043132 [Elysia crispata]|uniref:C-type lectin domain-containing protein n=1 Tax=Elysia crispata TaxID=231223 RepID=A0AAE0YMU3_9GAST|nr:hypothetical protein RRG08_043132 [Elysia crispata]